MAKPTGDLIMAQGDVTIFNEAIESIMNGAHNLGTDVLKLGFVNNTLAPTAATPTPTWGDFSANQQSGGTFPGVPETIAATVSEASGTTTVDLTTNVSYAKNASNPTDVVWGILYNSSKADQAVAFVEMDIAGADGTAGLISLTWGANFFTSTQT